MIISGGKVIAIDKVKTDNSTLAGDGRFDPVRLSDETVTKINTISAKVDGANKKIDTVSSNLSTLSSKVDTISGKVDKNTSDIAALSGEVQTNTKNIKTVSYDLYGLSAKTVTQIDTKGTLTASAALLPDGTVKYLLDCSPEIPQTIIHGKDGIYAEQFKTFEWNVGISANYLSANALNDLSGNWQSTYNTVKTNSAEWNKVSAKVNSADFIPVKDDVVVLKTYSAHYTVESTNDYITVDSVGKTYKLTFVSGDLATQTWVEEQIADFGGFEIAPDDGDGKPDVENPNPKKIYLVKSDPVAEDAYSEWIWVETAGAWGWACIGETSINLEPYLTKAEASAQYLTILSAEEIYQKKLPDSADFVPYSGKGIISVKDHIISAYSATPIAGSGIAIDWIGNNYTISVSGDYLSANSLADLSGRWESAYSAYSNSADIWNTTYEQFNTSSVKWNELYDEYQISSKLWNDTTDVVNELSGDWNEVSAKANSADLEELSGKVEALSGELEIVSGFIENKIDSLSSAIDGINDDLNFISGTVDKKLDISAFDNYSANISAEFSSTSAWALDTFFKTSEYFYAVSGTDSSSEYFNWSGDTLSASWKVKHFNLSFNYAIKPVSACPDFIYSSRMQVGNTTIDDRHYVEGYSDTVNYNVSFNIYNADNKTYKFTFSADDKLSLENLHISCIGFINPRTLSGNLGFVENGTSGIFVDSDGNNLIFVEKLSVV